MAAPAAVGILGRSLACALRCALPGLPVCMVWCSREFAESFGANSCIHVPKLAVLPSSAALLAAAPTCLAGCSRWASRPAPRTPRRPVAASPMCCLPLPPAAARTMWGRSRQRWACGTALAPLSSPHQRGCTLWRTDLVGGWVGGCWRLAAGAPMASCLTQGGSQHSVLGVLHRRSGPASPTQSTSRLPCSL